MSDTKETIFNVLLSTWRSVRRYNKNKQQWWQWLTQQSWNIKKTCTLPTDYFECFWEKKLLLFLTVWTKWVLYWSCGCLLWCRNSILNICSSKFILCMVTYINSNKKHMPRHVVHKIPITETIYKAITRRYKQNTHHKHWPMTNAWLYLQGNLDVAPSPTIQKRESFFHETLVLFPSLTQTTPTY